MSEKCELDAVLVRGIGEDESRLQRGSSKGFEVEVVAFGHRQMVLEPG